MDLINLKEGTESRQKRKEQAKAMKRKRIEESGGVRPRNVQTQRQTPQNTSDSNQPGAQQETQISRTTNMTSAPMRKKPKSKEAKPMQHRFGRVMEQAPCRNKSRYSTLSIAIPGSVATNCQTRELKTHLVGQIARAAAIYHVDEIIIFDDKLASEKNKGNRFRQFGNRRNDRDNRKPVDDANKGRDTNNQVKEEKGDEEQFRPRPKSDPHTFMARVLQYCECPQYLRRAFFPRHPDLQFAGLLPPIDAPHHVRVEDRTKYREGVVMDKKGPRGNSRVNCGIRNRPVEIDRVLPESVRCTVELDVKAYGSPGQIQGKVVSPATPREDNGIYWGYTTRLAASLNQVFEECPWEEGYDLKVGTSERGNTTVDDPNFAIPTYKHSLVVFGGVAGIEECVDADESMKIPGNQSHKLFDQWINTCPFQGSRTIRTEEAVLITLSRLSPHLSNNKEEEVKSKTVPANKKTKDAASVSFSDGSVSDESSDEE